MPAGAFVERQGDLAEELGEFAGAPPPQAVHLEKTILRVEITERAGDIHARGRLDRRHAERVARDGHRRAEPGQRGGAIELRQARAQLRVEPGEGQTREQDENAEQAAEKAKALAGRGRHAAMAARMPAMIWAGDWAMSMATALTGSSSVASWLSSIAGFMKCPCRPLIRDQSTSRVPRR